MKKYKENKRIYTNPLKEDYTKDQISIKEYMDPFTGEKIKIVIKNPKRFSASRGGSAIDRHSDCTRFTACKSTLFGQSKPQA